MPQTAVTYSRVSSLQQTEGFSLASQQDATKAYCDFKQWRITNHLVEAGKSGRTQKKRPKLAKALEIVCHNKGVLVVHKLDRLVRSAADCEEICDRLESAGARLVSVTESIDTATAAGKAFVAITAVFARLESDRISERVKAANDYTTRKLGYRTQGMMPAGWKVVDGVRVVIPEEMKIVNLILEMGEDGEKACAIANELNSQDVPTINKLRRGWDTVWNFNSVTKILKRKVK
jgi:site-specific DNA recombinase